MKVINSVKFLLKVLKLLGCIPFSASTFQINFLDLFYPVLILTFFISLMIVRLSKNDDLSQLGSEVSKLTMNIIFGFGVFYLAINPIANLINRGNIKNLCIKIESIEEKVKMIFFQVAGHLVEYTLYFYDVGVSPPNISFNQFPALIIKLRKLLNKIKKSSKNQKFLNFYSDFFIYF